MKQIYNVYSLGVAVLAVIFLQWLLLYQRRHEESDNDTSSIRPSASSVDMDTDRRPSSTDIIIPSITVVPPSPILDNGDDSDDNDEAEPVQVEADSSPAATDMAPASPASEKLSDDEAAEILPAPASAFSPRRNSEASANVLQLINEQRRFSVSATSAKNATAGGVTGQLCTRPSRRPYIFTAFFFPSFFFFSSASRGAQRMELN